MVTCPACLEPLPDSLPMVGAMTVCPSCARSLVIEDAEARIARDTDVQALSEDERTRLRALRPAAWRADVKARLTAIRGKAR